ncbi:CASP-like protein 1E1 [Lycium ferocissimum]|uniref:CASP-like protein 1E1 n=1 Tax=Lycium ferocissimum TaxID=112874 RepID=UPI00281503E4|nr:CASP-like protein 1E1 [Lycium ferocissimum]
MSVCERRARRLALILPHATIFNQMSSEAIESVVTLARKKYFVIVNAVACAFAATSTAFQALMGGSRGRNWTGSVLVVALDLTMVALLFSANGASAAVGLIALNGNPHTQWHKVCYCIQGGAALAMSMLGSFFFLCLVLLLTLNLHRSTLNY